MSRAEIREHAVEGAIGAGVAFALWLAAEAIAWHFTGCSAFTC